jgi:heat shock protein HslJ
MNALRFAALILLASTIAASGQTGRGGGQQPQQDQGARPPPKQEKVFPAKVPWTAVSLNGKPLTGERPSIILDDNFRIKGFGGCNTFSATGYPLRQQGFAVGPIALTKRACAAPVMASERQFLLTLRGTQKWDLVGGGLVFQGAAGELKFERAL